MRKVRPVNGPVQGKTGDSQKSIDKKRPALADISHTQVNKKSLSQKRAEAESSAVFIMDASPRTSKEVKKAIQSDSILSSVLTPSRLNVGERSPGGAPKWVETKTPRKRTLDRSNDFPMNRRLKNGEQKAIRGVFLSKRLNSHSPEKSVPLPEELASKPLSQQAFGPVSITQADVQKVPSRSSLKKEKAVTGKSAKAAVDELFLETPAPAFHLSHIVGVALGAGKIDTQVKENLFVGTGQANWTKKNYELELRRVVSQDPKRNLELSGVAHVVAGTPLAKTESLQYDFQGSGETHISGTLHFDTLRAKTESVLPSRVFGKLIDTVIEIDDEEGDRTLPRLKK